MPFAVPSRLVAGLILCSLAAGVLLLAGCAKVPVAVPPEAKERPSTSCVHWNTQVFFETATVSAVTACLAAGADLEARTVGHIHLTGGKTPLHHAASSSRKAAVVKALLAAGADVNDRGGGFTPLHTAVATRHAAAAVKLLLVAGADVTARADGSTDETPLHYVTGDSDIVDVVSDSQNGGSD